jgi:hypothetical protein
VPGVVDTLWWSQVPDEARKELFEKSATSMDMQDFNPQ